MEKEFSFLEMLKYCFRKWFIVLIAIVLGGGALFVYAIADRPSPTAQYNGSVTIGNFDVFYPGASESSESIKNYIDTYNSVFSRAVDVMLSPGIINVVYKKNVLDTTPLGQKPIILEAEFLQNFTAVKSSLGISVVFKFNDSSDVNVKFASDVVNSFLDEAINVAILDKASLADSNKLFKNNIYVSADLNPTKGRSIGTNLFLGLAGGLVLGLLITAIIYLADRRVKSHLDVCYFAGDRIFRANSGVDNNTVCPKLSSSLAEKAVKTVLVASTDVSGFELGTSFADFSSSTDYKTLYIEFSGGDGLKKLFAGETEINNNIIKADIADGTLVLANRAAFDRVVAKFDRVVLSAKFIASGQLAPLGVVCDAVVTVVNQPITQRKEIESMIYEISQLEKCIGTVINNASKSYVGRVIE